MFSSRLFTPSRFLHWERGYLIVKQCKKIKEESMLMVTKSKVKAGNIEKVRELFRFLSSHFLGGGGGLLLYKRREKGASRDSAKEGSLLFHSIPGYFRGKAMQR